MDRAKAIDRAAKCLALFHGSNNPGEKETAKRQCLALTNQHSITVVELRASKFYYNPTKKETPTPEPKPTASRYEEDDWYYADGYYDDIDMQLDELYQTLANSIIRKAQRWGINSLDADDWRMINLLKSQGYYFDAGG